MKTKLTEDQEKKIVRQYKSGMIVSEICFYNATSPRIIKDIFKKYKVKVRKDQSHWRNQKI